MPRHACLRLALLSLMVIVGACAAPPDGPAPNDYEDADYEKAGHERAGHERAGQEASDKTLIDWMFDGLIRSALDRERHGPKTKRPPEISPEAAPGMSPALPSRSPPGSSGEFPGGAVQGDSIQGDSIQGGSVQGDSVQAREMQRLIDVMNNPDMPRPRGPR